MGFRAVRYNAGIIDIDGDQLTFTALGEDGEAFYTETLSADALTPRDDAQAASHASAHKLTSVP